MGFWTFSSAAELLVGILRGRGNGKEEEPGEP